MTYKLMTAGDSNPKTAKGAELPTTYNGRPVIDGDEHDLRFMDPANVIVGLRAKGKGKKDTSGFVIAV